MTKPTKEEILAQPERYRVLNGGAVYDYDAGHIVAHLHHGDGPYQITTANARAMVERKKQKRINSHFRGMARGAGIDIDENAPEEELLDHAANALELYVAHLGRTFLKSENLRGMGESFTKLVLPFGEEPDQEESPLSQARGLIHELAELSKEINRTQERQQINGNVIANAHEVIEAE
jgi:hypothetical protein